jgi:hypothetical protein
LTQHHRCHIYNTTRCSRQCHHSSLLHHYHHYRHYHHHLLQQLLAIGPVAGVATPPTPTVSSINDSNVSVINSMLRHQLLHQHHHMMNS